jgi:hypothetical protein
MVNEAFCYEQLDLTKQQIRLVTVKPKSPEREDVERDIHVFDIDTTPPYVTLSYTCYTAQWKALCDSPGLVSLSVVLSK